MEIKLNAASSPLRTTATVSQSSSAAASSYEQIAAEEAKKARSSPRLPRIPFLVGTYTRITPLQTITRLGYHVESTYGILP